MQKFSKSLNFGMEKYVPESYLFAVFLVFVVFLMGIVIAGKGPMDMATYFSNKMWNFLAFSMQMVLMIVTGFVCATTPIGKKIFSVIGRIPKTSVQAVILVCTLIRTGIPALGHRTGGRRPAGPRNRPEYEEVGLQITGGL